MPNLLTHEPATKRAVDRAVNARLAELWASGTERSRGETAGFLLAEIDVMLAAWVKAER